MNPGTPRSKLGRDPLAQASAPEPQPAPVGAPSESLNAAELARRIVTFVAAETTLRGLALLERWLPAERKDSSAQQDSVA